MTLLLFTMYAHYHTTAVLSIETLSWHTSQTEIGNGSHHIHIITPLPGSKSWGFLSPQSNNCWTEIQKTKYDSMKSKLKLMYRLMNEKLRCESTMHRSKLRFLVWYFPKKTILSKTDPLSFVTGADWSWDIIQVFHLCIDR